MMRTRPQLGLHALMIMMTMTSIPGASKNGLTDFGFLFFSIHYGGLLSLLLIALGSLIGMWRTRRYIISVHSNSTFFEIPRSRKRAYRGSDGSRKVWWPLFVRGCAFDGSPILASARNQDARSGNLARPLSHTIAPCIGAASQIYRPYPASRS
jgi:hypothetical protein